MLRDRSARRSSPRVSIATLTLAALAASCGGNGRSSSAGDAAQAPHAAPGTAANTLSPSDQILGFENVGAWAASSGTVSATGVRTQGASALALQDPGDEAELRSDPVSTDAVAFTGLGDAGSSLAIDVLLPARRGEVDDDDRDDGDDHGRGDGDDDGRDRGKGYHHSRGHGSQPDGDRDRGDGTASLKLLLKSDALGPHPVSLGRVHLRSRPGIYATARFALHPDVRRKLASGTHIPEVVIICRTSGRGRGTWMLDNIRVHSPGAPLPGAGRSADLLAIRTYAPPSSQPGEATFPVGLVQIPRDLHVKKGNAGRGSATLELAFGSDVFTTCTFRSSGGGTGYRLRSCTGGPRAGDLVSADHARLTLLDGDPAAGPTKVLAQLAVNPVGDTAGSGVIPPMPTFWGDTPDEISAIATRYFDQVNRGPRTEERWISAPVPDFALRHGDGLPHDNLTGPPPPRDPPFDMEGHLNQGGTWDGYWRLAGTLSADNTAARHKAHLDAGLSAHAVAWGHDVSVVSVNATIDTDYGQLDNGLAGSSAAGGLHLYLFGVEVAGKNFTSGSSVSFQLDAVVPFDLPPIQIWIFEITLGLRGGVHATGSAGISPAGLALLFTPKATIAAHIEGGVNIVVASGTVSADIDLIAVATPFGAQAGWVVSTDPAVCNASLAMSLDGDLKLSTLGGTVKLNATFGICPFCDHESFPIFSWTGLDIGTVPLFHILAGLQVFPLPSSLCRSALNVKIEYPPAGASLVAGIPWALDGRATPGPTAGNPNPADADCSALHWSTDQATDQQLAAGCEPLFVFDPARLGPRTISLHAEDAFGETGDAAPVTVSIVAPQPGLHAYITAPSPVLLGPDGKKGTDTVLHFIGAATGASSGATFTWTARVLPGGTPFPLGTGREIDWAPGLTEALKGPHEVTLTVTDGASSATATVEVAYIIIT